MKTGITLKKKLGLNNIAVVKVSRILDLPTPSYLIWYDSHRPTRPITTRTVKKYPGVGQVYRGIKGFKEPVRFTPPMLIEDFTGNLSTGLYFAIDLSGRFLVDTKILENKQKLNYSIIVEFLQLADLMKSQGMSDFTRPYRSERNRVTGIESNVAKLVDLELNQEDNSITFKWLTEPTDKYGPEAQFKQVDPSTLAMGSNSSKTYDMDIKILNFFDWLDTYSNKTEITRKDMKDIFDVSYVQVWSNDPSFQYQGINYWLTQVDASIHPTNIAPKQWNNPGLHGDGNAFLSKHLGGLINGIKFWYQPMASKLTKRLKDEGIL